MPKYTNNYSLIKPSKNENYDVDQTTSKNMDIIDTELHKRIEKQAGKGLSSNDFTDGYKSKIDTLSNVYNYKGSKATYDELPKQYNRSGDVWAVISESKSYAWNGQNWEDIGLSINFSVLVTKEEFEDFTNNMNTTLKKIEKETVPTGGTTGQVLTKKSDKNNDVKWADKTEQEITVVNNLESESDTDALSANQGKVLNEKITNTAKLIYSKTTTEEDANGFDITEITLKDGKQYEILVDGAIQSASGTTDLTNLTAKFNKVDETTLLRRTVLNGLQNGESAGGYATTGFVRLLRCKCNFSSLARILLNYSNNYIKTQGNYVCFGTGIEDSVNLNIATMLGEFTGDINYIRISAGDEDTDKTIRTGTTIKIFELP